jgi:hypothetical protein
MWAPDPFGRFELRYWNGTRWTEHVSTWWRQQIDPEFVTAPITPPDVQMPHGEGGQ